MRKIRTWATGKRRETEWVFTIPEFVGIVLAAIIIGLTGAILILKLVASI